MKLTFGFWRQISKSGGAQNFNAKPTLYNIFSNILFNVFNWRYQTFSKKDLQAYKIKPVLFLFGYVFWRQPQLYSELTRIVNYHLHLFNKGLVRVI